MGTLAEGKRRGGSVECTGQSLARFESGRFHQRKVKEVTTPMLDAQPKTAEELGATLQPRHRKFVETQDKPSLSRPHRVAAPSLHRPSTLGPCQFSNTSF